MFANEDKYPTFESFADYMKGNGYDYIDLNPDDLGKRYANWYYKNRRSYETSFASYASRPNVWFYKPRTVPIPLHPNKGEGRFEAIYFHFFPDHICDISHVETEIINVNPCRMVEINGEPLNGISRTSLTRLLPYNADTFKRLMLIRGAYISLHKQWKDLTEGKTLNEEIHEIYLKNIRSYEGKMEQ